MIKCWLESNKGRDHVTHLGSGGEDNIKMDLKEME